MNLKFRKSNVAIIFLMYVLGLAIKFLYLNFTQGDYENNSFLPPQENFFSIILFIFGAPFLSYFVPKKIEKPSDIFFLVYVFLVLLPKISLIDIYFDEGTLNNILLLFLLSFPIFVVKILLNSKLSFIKFPTFSLKSNDIYFICMLCIPLFIYTFYNLREINFSLNFFDNYSRRYELREFLEYKNFLRYFLSIFTYAIIPFLTFYFAFKKNMFYLFIPASLSILIFGISGERYHFFLIIISAICGTFIDKDINWSKKFTINSLFFILCLFLIFFLELIYNQPNYSYISDYLLRRLFIIPSFCVEVYYHFICYDPSYTIFSGAYNVNNINLFLGDAVFQNKGVNLDVNFILHALALNGIFYLSLIVLLLFLWLSLIDSCCKNRVSFAYFWLSLMGGLILFEQALTTAFISSGLGLLTIFLVFTKYDKI
jgi:hypothetical protein